MSVDNSIEFPKNDTLIRESSFVANTYAFILPANGGVLANSKILQKACSDLI
jgi:hypothetical protein